MKGFVKVVKKYHLRNKKEKTTNKSTQNLTKYDELKKFEEASELTLEEENEKNDNLNEYGEAMVKIVPKNNTFSRVTLKLIRING